jgi:hypothetical protein
MENAWTCDHMASSRHAKKKAATSSMQGKERKRPFAIPWWGWVLIVAAIALLVAGGFLAYAVR